MLQYEVLKHELNEKQAALDELKDALGLERLREEVEMRWKTRRRSRAFTTTWNLHRRFCRRPLR